MAATLKQIAEAAGVSRGTVDRVLHGRGHVNPELEERVSRLLKEMGYQPNRLGRGLVMSGRAIKLGMICQFSETPFMKLVLNGAEQARMELKSMNTELYIESIDSYDADRMLATIDQMLERGVHGLALTPGNSPAIHEKMCQVIQEGVPIVTLNSDAPDTGRLAYVGLDNYRAGRAAAGLMSLTLRDGGTILPLSGYTENTSHTQRMKGFFDAVEHEFPKLRLLDLKHCYDVDAIAEKIVDNTLKSHPDLAGIYISGNGQTGVCRALRRFQKAGKVCVLCFDLTQGNVAELEKGSLDFILDQNAGEQGYRPAILLYDKLLLGEEPTSEYLYTDICIKTRFNL